VEIAERCVAIDEQDGGFSGGLGHGGEAVGRMLSSHGVNPQERRNTTVLLRNRLGGSCARVRRPDDLHQTTYEILLTGIAAFSVHSERL
jgi:hypothetical protein